MDKPTTKKLLGSISGMTLIILILTVSMLALFATNRGFGWFNKSTQANASGMMVDVDSPDSPVKEFQFHTVHSTRNFVSHEEVEYAFTPLGDGTAHMVMGNYSKLEAPTYHILLHVTFKDNVQAVKMSTKIQSGTLTVSAGQLLGMVQSGTPVGMSAALEFYLLLPDADYISTETTPKLDEAGQEIEGEYTQLLWLDSAILSGKTNHMFPVDESTTDAGPTLTYSGMEDITIDLEGQHELYVFITYSSDRVNLLQDYAHNAADGDDTSGDQNKLDEANFNFASDFYIFFEKTEAVAGE